MGKWKPGRKVQDLSFEIKIKKKKRYPDSIVSLCYWILNRLHIVKIRKRSLLKGKTRILFSTKSGMLTW